MKKYFLLVVLSAILPLDFYALDFKNNIKNSPNYKNLLKAAGISSVALIVYLN